MWYITCFDQDLSKLQRDYCIFYSFIFFAGVAFILVIILQKLTIENRRLEISLYNQIYMSHKDSQRLFSKELRSERM